VVENWDFHLKNISLHFHRTVGHSLRSKSIPNTNNFENNKTRSLSIFKYNKNQIFNNCIIEELKKWACSHPVQYVHVLWYILHCISRAVVLLYNFDRLNAMRPELFSIYRNSISFPERGREKRRTHTYLFIAPATSFGRNN